MVLVKRGEGEWHEPAVTSYVSEKELQKLIMLQPSLLPGGVQMAIVDEFRVPEIGSVDLVGVSAEGEITLVECKLKSNPQIRREVVGQILAYAGGVWRMNYDDFAEEFASRAGENLVDAIQTASGDEIDGEELRESIRRRLADGEFQLVVAVDKITPELRRIIEFLNGRTATSLHVVALELGIAKDGDTQFLLPRTYGEQISVSRTGSKWNSARFTEEVESLADSDEKAFIYKLLEHGGQKGHHAFYGSGLKPGMSYYYEVAGRQVSVWGLYLKEPVPKVGISLGALNRQFPDRAAQLLNALKARPELSSYLAGINESNMARKRPQIRIADALLNEETQNAFFSALDRVIE